MPVVSALEVDALTEFEASMVYIGREGQPVLHSDTLSQKEKRPKI